MNLHNIKIILLFHIKAHVNNKMIKQFMFSIYSPLYLYFINLLIVIK